MRKLKVARANLLVSKYNLLEKEYWELYDKQDGRCAICKLPLQISEQIDHDHKTGLVRGLLCLNCNAGLGQLKDDPVLVARALEYLQTPPGTGIQKL